MTPNLVTSGDSSNCSTDSQRHMISYTYYTASFVSDKPSIICLCSVFQSFPTGNWAQLPRRARSMWFSRSAVQGHKCAERCCWAEVIRHYKLAIEQGSRRHLVSCRFTIYRRRPYNDKDHKNQLRHVCPSTLTRPQRPDPRFPMQLYEDCVFVFGSSGWHWRFYDNSS